MPKFRSIIPQTVERIKAASNVLLARAATSHVSVSKQLAAVDTGFMRDNIRVVAVPRGNGLIDFFVVSEAIYSLFVEFGTINMEAQPFFIPGYHSAVVQLKAEAKTVIDGILAGAGTAVVRLDRVAA